MEIAAFNKQTLLDYPGKLAAEVFTRGCNYKCPTCHAKYILETDAQVNENEVLSYLKKTKGFVDGLVVCGGEPTLQRDLPEFLKRIKQETGLPIKLDTNGSNPNILEEILKEKLVDYVAMDIKGPTSLYKKLIGLSDNTHFDLRDNVEKSIGIIQNSPDYEFRTTIIPIYRDEKQMSFMTPEEAKQMADWVRSFIFTDPSKVKWYLQKFISRKKEEDSMLDERFSRENLPLEFRETPDSIMKAIQESAKTSGINFLIRN